MSIGKGKNVFSDLLKITRIFWTSRTFGQQEDVFFDVKVF